jgi:beta-lactam-binding protein with PASTA domain
LNLKIVDSAYNAKKRPLTVLDQTPTANAKVKEGRTIYLTVNSRIPPMIKMPELKDASLKQAQMILESAGLNVGKLIYNRTSRKTPCSISFTKANTLKRALP